MIVPAVVYGSSSLLLNLGLVLPPEEVPSTLINEVDHRLACECSEEMLKTSKGAAECGALGQLGGVWQRILDWLEV